MRRATPSRRSHEPGLPRVSWSARRKFWQHAGVTESGAGFAVSLDARPLMTPAGLPLLVPTESLAEAIAGEWNALDDEILPARLPLTRLANTAIDRVARDHSAVVATVSEYGGADLICYRAASPEALAARQAASWDPWLEWAALELDAPLFAVSGLMHHPQPDASLVALKAAVAACDPFALTALHELVTLSGSLILGLVVAGSALIPETAWDLSRIDEEWQAEQWGTDAEAEAAAAAKRADFLRAAALLRMLARSA
jgi:chaperone required for assembly of F1-ATPase